MPAMLTVLSSSFSFSNSNYNNTNTNTNVSSHLSSLCSISLANMAKNDLNANSAGTIREGDIKKSKGSEKN